MLSWLSSILFRWKAIYLSHFATVFYERAFFIFGGDDYNDANYEMRESLSGIGRLDAEARTWSLAAQIGKETSVSKQLIRFSCFCFEKWNKNQ